MDDPFESQLRQLMREDASGRPPSADDKRLERVLHRAHIHSGLFDLLRLFASWGWVIGEGGGRGLRQAAAARRERRTSSTDLNS